MAEHFERHAPRFDEREYQRFVLAVELFLRKKNGHIASEIGRLQKSQSDLAKKRSELIETKARLVLAKSFDRASKAHFDHQIQEMSDRLESVIEQKKKMK